MSDIIDLLTLGTRDKVLIVGVEQDPDEPEFTRVYFGARYRWEFVLCSGEEAEKVKSAWGGLGHLWMKAPEQFYRDDAKLAEMKEARDADARRFDAGG